MMVRGGLASLTVAVVAACSGAATPTQPMSNTPTAAPTAAPTATPRPSPTLPTGVSMVVEIGEPVWGIAAAGDAVWVEGANRLLQLDAVSGEQRLELPGSWPTVSGDSLWYLRDDQLVEADPTTGEERSAYTPPQLGTNVLDGVLWAANHETGVLYAIDLESNQVVHEIDLPDGEPKWVEPWEGAIWVVVDQPSGVMVRVDPGTGNIVGTTDAGLRPHSVALAFGSLWVTDHGSANVYRFRADGTLEATIPGPGINVAITATDTAVWAAGATAIMEIDPTTNGLGREIRLGGGDWYGLAASEGFLWLTSADRGRLIQMPVEGS